MNRTQIVLALSIALLLALALLCWALQAHGRSSGAQAAPSNASAQAVAEETASAVAAADRAAAPFPEPPPAEMPQRPQPVPEPGRILVRVRDAVDDPVSALVVLRTSRREPLASKATGEDGQVEFDWLAPGNYQVEVDPASLPIGFVPPFEQDNIVHYQASIPAGYYGRQVEIEGAGDEHSVDLRVFRPASVDGYLLGPAGEPVADALVRLQSNWRGLERLVGDGVTDATGFFSVASLHPGRYVTEVHFALDHPYLAVTRPAPQRLELSDGEHRTLTLHMAAGRWSLEGRVVDDEGKPFPRIDVRCMVHQDPQSLGPDERFAGGDLAIALTDDAGRYAFHGLPACPVKLLVGVNAHTSSRAPGDDKIVELKTSDVYDGAALSGPVEVPDIVARRSRPFVVTGRVEVDSAWLEGRNLSPRDLELQARSASGATKAVEIAKDWTFVWWCETPSDPVELVLVAARRGVVHGSAKAHVDPEPNGRVSIVLRIP